MTTYATPDQLASWLGATYTAPEEEEATRMLGRASQLIDTATRGRAQQAYDGRLSQGHLIPAHPVTPWTQDDYQEALADAACAQVEFWLEFGEEHDIVGLTGFANAGRLQIGKLPGRLGARARDRLVEAGLLSARVWIE